MCKIYESKLFDFTDKNKVLSKEQSFPTKFITQIDLDDWCSSSEFKKTATWRVVTKWLTNQQTGEEDDLGVTEDDLHIIRAVCSLISGRSALLLAICVAEIFSRIDKVDQTVAVDGSVFKHHLKMRDQLDNHVKRMVKNKNVNLILAEDGSGKGAECCLIYGYVQIILGSRCSFLWCSGRTGFGCWGVHFLGIHRQVSISSNFRKGEN